MRQYRHATPAERDARRERTMMTRPHRDPLPAREAGALIVAVNGQRIALDLQPDRRDCRRWIALRDGQPFARGGLERIWRAVQAEIVPMLGARNL